MSGTASAAAESRKRYLAPAEIFAGLALVPVPVEPEKLWLVATAGVGLLALILATLLVPVRWLLGLVKGGSAPLKAAIGTSLVATVAVPAAIVTLVSLDGGSWPDEARTRRRRCASRRQPARRRRQRSRSHPPARPRRRPRRRRCPPRRPSSLPHSRVRLRLQAAVSNPAPTPTETPVSLSSGGGETPAPTATPTPAPLPAAPATLVVLINLTPPKTVPLHSSATVHITIFGSESFPVSGVDLPALRFGGAEVRQDHTKDVDNDGHLDLVLHFKVSDITIPVSGDVCLEGQTLSGIRFSGCALIFWSLNHIPLTSRFGRNARAANNSPLGPVRFRTSPSLYY